jgi:hypothetical protein
MTKYQNVTIPMKREEYLKLRELALIETRKHQYGNVTITGIVRKLISDFIENYEKEETK